MSVGDRMDGDYTTPILAEPAGGPIPSWDGGDEVDDEPDIQAAVADKDAARIQHEWEQAKADLLKVWPVTAQPMVDELAAQAEAAVADDNLGVLGQLAASARVITAMGVVLTGKGSKLAKQAAAGVVAEAAGQGIDLPAGDYTPAARVQKTADAVAHLIAAGYASGAGRIALQLAGADPAEVKTAVEEHLTELGASGNGLVGDNVGALLSAAQHAGRLSVLEKHPADGYVAIEINDQHRCGPCSEANGKHYSKLADALDDYPHAGLKSCAGGSRCRGHIRPIFKR
jgi:hypothetical protein